MGKSTKSLSGKDIKGITRLEILLIILISLIVIGFWFDLFPVSFRQDSEADPENIARREIRKIIAIALEPDISNKEELIQRLLELEGYERTEEEESFLREEQGYALSLELVGISGHDGILDMLLQVFSPEIIESEPLVEKQELLFFD